MSTFIKPKIKPKQQRELVKVVWDALANTGMCDSYGGAEYLRTNKIVYDFVAKLYGECNMYPVSDDKEENT